MNLILFIIGNSLSKNILFSQFVGIILDFQGPIFLLLLFTVATHLRIDDIDRMLGLVGYFFVKEFLFDDVLICFFLVFHFGVVDVLGVFLILIDHMILVHYLSYTVLPACVGLGFLFVVGLLAHGKVFDVFVFQWQQQIVNIALIGIFSYHRTFLLSFTLLSNHVCPLIDFLDIYLSIFDGFIVASQDVLRRFFWQIETCLHGVL